MARERVTYFSPRACSPLTFPPSVGGSRGSYSPRGLPGPSGGAAARPRPIACTPGSQANGCWEADALFQGRNLQGWPPGWWALQRGGFEAADKGLGVSLEAKVGRELEGRAEPFPPG